MFNCDQHPNADADKDIHADVDKYPDRDSDQDKYTCTDQYADTDEHTDDDTNSIDHTCCYGYVAGHSHTKRKRDCDTVAIRDPNYNADAAWADANGAAE